MLCVVCNEWGHLKCSSESESFFQSNEDWTCDACLWKGLPLADSSNTSIVNKSSDDVNHPVVNQSLNSDHVLDDPIQTELSRLQSYKGLKIAHLNCLSLMKHIDELRSIVTQSDIDIMTLSETHLCSSIDDNEVSIPGYTCLRRDRNRNGGGVAMYIKNDLIFLRKDEFCQNMNLEIIVVEIKLEKQKPFLVICWYRPPNSKLETFSAFENVIQNIDDMQLPYYILGDMNCDVSNKCMPWHTKRLIDIMECYNCTQVINDYTRVTRNSSTTVDLIFSNSKSKISKSCVVEVSMSDHYMIYCVLGKPSCNDNGSHKYKRGRSLKKFDEEAFRKDMNDIDFDPLYQIEDPEAACSAFFSLIIPIVDKHAPLRNTRIKQKESPWMTTDILQSIRKRDRLKLKAKKSKSLVDWEKYKKARNNVTNNIRQAKRNFISTNIESAVGDVKKVWKTLRYLAPEKKADNGASSIKINDSYVHGQEMSNAFNEYFSKIGKTLHKNFPANVKKRHTKTPSSYKAQFVFKDVTQDEIENIIKTLPVNKATGPDNLPAKLLRHVASVISSPVTHIINQSLRTGIIPSEWKCARVTPIFKGGDKACMENYRPISVIPILAKIMEKIVYKQLFQYVTDNNILSDCQSGFRPMYSTQSALLNVCDKWLVAIDNGNIVGVVMIDLKKAFDTVDHKTLLEKLEVYGFSEITLEWFKNYLTGRKQFTSVNGYISDKEDIVCRVPQGSLLGPLLFSIFVNDMPNNTHCCDLALYADDTCLFTSSKDPREITRKLNEDLLSLSNWLKDNKLMVNPKKCEVMFIGTRQRLQRVHNSLNDCRVYIDDMEIRKVEACKYLGVVIDQNLLWHNQVDHVKKKIIKCMYLLKRLRPYITKDTALLFYKSVLQCHFDYCSPVWANASKSYLTQLQTLQNRSLRIVMNVDYMHPSDNL